jgi:CRISPR/Cas system-associated exonuclease Cas4 (RecB family)
MIAVAPDAIDTKSRLEVFTEEVSASRLALWSSCRLKFYFKYVMQLEKPATPALHVGKTVHSILQAWNMARWKGIVMDHAGIGEKFIQCWNEEQLGQDIDFNGEEQKEKDTALALIDLYLKQTPIPEDEKPQAVEIWLEADLAKHGLPRLIGIIDLVRAGGKIVDFKTSGQTPNPERVAHQTEIQLTSYGLLYRDATGQKESGFELHHLVKVKSPKLVVTPLPAVTENQVTRLFKQMDSYMEGLSREDFVPSPGLQCMACQYFNECRRWSYGILIRKDCADYRENRALYCHEFVHVGQYERYSSINAFLVDYLKECITPGYPLGPLEKQADRRAAKIVRDVA